MARIELKCGFCNKTFLVPNHLKKRIFCSRNHSLLHRNKYNNPVKNLKSLKKMIQSKKGQIPWQKQLGLNHPKVIKYKQQMAIGQSKRRKGKMPWNKGLTKEDPRVYLNTMYSRLNNPSKNPEIAKKISETCKRKGLFKGDKNPSKLPYSRQKISEGLKKAYQEGRKQIYKEKNPNWKGGISREPYSFEFNEELKERIKKRDNYKCKECKISQAEHIQKYSKKLTIHHINYDKQNCSENNLLTLCIYCNSIANGNRQYWQEKYQQLLNTC